MKSVRLTREQTRFVKAAQDGKNVLVDACIGSGKTTAIQRACKRMPDKKILYLTYNHHLRDDARARMGGLDNVTVHDHHSFCLEQVVRERIKFDDIGKVPRLFVEKVKRVPKYDIVIVDEYQDLDTDTADMLCKIRDFYPNYQPQFLFVGDMNQKIYNYSTLKVKEFMLKFMSSLRGGYEKMTFIKCHRLSAEYAAEIGEGWGKTIIGVNKDFQIQHIYKDLNKLVDILGKYNPEDILVLGSGGSNGVRTDIQNLLENKYPDKFNKNTLFASTWDNDGFSEQKNTAQSAIFTTFGTTKGLERPVCVVCDFEKWYIHYRRKSGMDETILKNTLFVAASRGKQRIIFFHQKKSDHLTFKQICNELKLPFTPEIRPVHMSDAFSGVQVKKEHVEACLKFLDRRLEKTSHTGKINSIHLSDGHADLSACIGIFTQAVFFKKYDLDSTIIDAVIAQFYNEQEEYDKDKQVPLSKKNKVYLPPFNPNWNLRRKILYLTALVTGQARYFTEVSEDFVSAQAERMIKQNLSEVFTGNESAEVPCSIEFKNSKIGGSKRSLEGRVDVMKNGKPYELKFVNKLTDQHFLQAALYMVAMDKQVGRLWNIRDNTRYEIRIKDREGFLKAVHRCIAKEGETAKIAYLPDTPNGKTYSIV